MRREVVIADNFYEDPDAVVRYAHSLEYVAPYQTRAELRAGVKPTWITSRFRQARHCRLKRSEGLLAKLEFLTGEKIDRHHWNLGFPLDDFGYPTPGFQQLERSALWNACFHAKFNDQQELGEGVHNHVNDDWNYVGEDGWAGLIYLNHDPDKAAGLRTWENRNPARKYEWDLPAKEWILQDTFANIYNRIVLHRGGIPHSGAAGWGDTLSDGRFFQTFFFKTLGPLSSRSVTPDDLGLPSHPPFVYG